ncbi:MAG: DUF2066 domain-containing protein [Flavobacteriaceae bacterium]
MRRLLPFLLLLLLPLAARAGDLYLAEAFVTGRGEESARAAFAQAFPKVLGKVSGDWRLAGDPRVAALAGDAGSHVESFTATDRMAGIPLHDEEGTRKRPHIFAVAFDRAGIDRVLAELGSRPWPEPRPRILVIVDVANGREGFTLVRGGAKGRDMADALAVAAGEAGLGIALPAGIIIAMRDPYPASRKAGDARWFSKALEEAGARIALAGRLTWNPLRPGWSVDWMLEGAVPVKHWSVDGVSFDAAFRAGLRGAAQVLSGNGAP